MTSTEAQIQAAASKNKELLSILAETDYAPATLEQQQKYVKDLSSELSNLDAQIKKLETNRVKELKEHEKYRDSVMKRFAYRIGRKTEKFDAKAEKEEREYFDALHEEHRAKDQQRHLQTNLDSARSQASQLEGVVSRHRQAQTDLDALYDSIFEGPTPGFPEEDEKESAAEHALQSYHNLRSQSESEQHALQILTQANKKMNEALHAMDEARDHSRMDMFGGGAMWDMMERNALSRAENLSMEVQMLVMQAQRMSSQVGRIPKPQIAQGNLMSDVLFDNVFTDHAFHQKIKASQEEMHASAKALDQEGSRCKQRIDGMQSQLQDEGRRLEDSRVQLQKAREMAFERVAGSAY